MRSVLPQVIASGLLAQGVAAFWLLPEARNFIYIVPDGYGQASHRHARLVCWVDGKWADDGGRTEDGLHDNPVPRQSSDGL